VLDHPEAKLTGRGFDLRPEVVHETADHLVGKSLHLRIDDVVMLGNRRRRVPRRRMLRRQQVNVDDERSVRGEIRELQVVLPAEVLGRGDRAVASLRQRDAELVEVCEAQAELAAQCAGDTLRHRDECRRCWDLQLG